MENRPKFSDLGGIRDVLDRVEMEVLFPFCQPQVRRTLGLSSLSVILIHGPPGCGKTTLARAIANEERVPIHEISSTKWLLGGGSVSPEQNIRTAPCVVFVDEIDAIASNKEDIHDGMKRLRLLTQLKKCIDESYQLGCSNNCAPVLIIGAANELDRLDFFGRFGVVIGLDFPGEEARLQIVTKLTCGSNMDVGVDMRKIARSSQGFVAADLAALVNEARTSAKNMHGVEEVIITLADFEKARKMVQPPIRKVFSVLPCLKWGDIGGLNSLKETLDANIVHLIKHPEVAEEFGLELRGGILLYGPPDCGKVMVAKALAKKLRNSNFYRPKLSRNVVEI